MATDNPRQEVLTTGSSASKKRLATSAELEQRRPKLIRLYLDERKSKKDIVEIMRKEEGLEVSEKQLKTRFEEKWRIGKNNTKKSREMAQTAMVASNIGNRILLPAGTSSEQQPYLKGGNVVNIQRGKENPQQVDCFQLTTRQQFSLSNHLPNTFPNANAEMLTQASESDLTNFTPGQLDFSISNNLDAPITLELGSMTPGFQNHDALDTFEALTRTQSTPPTEMFVSSGHANIPFVPDTLTLPLLSIANQTTSTEPAWDFNEYFPATFESINKTRYTQLVPSSPQILNDFLSTDQSENPWPQHNALASELSPMNLDPSMLHNLTSRTTINDNVPLETQLQPYSRFPLPGGIQFIGSSGADPETVIPGLQILEKRILQYLDQSDRPMVFSLSGPSRAKFPEVADYNWLRSELNSILQWAYQMSANKRLESYTLPFGPSSSKTEQVGGFQHPHHEATTSRIVGRASRQLLHVGCQNCSNSTISLTALHNHLNEDIEQDKDEGIYYVVLSYTPALERGNQGISITFTRTPRSSPRFRIFPTIRTFNIISDESEIVDLILADDLDGVRKLFQLGEASPTDLTGNGVPLIMYARKNGFSDTYKLLVDEGLKSQLFEHLHMTTELLCLRDWKVSTLSCIRIRDTDVDVLSSLEECIKMTEHALAHGVELRSDEPANPHSPNLLFDQGLPFETDHLTEVPSIFRKMAQYLIRKGYDREEQNCVGQTPLLSVAASTQDLSHVWLQSLLAIEVNVHAADKYGRGALHSVLLIARMPFYTRKCSKSGKYVDNAAYFLHVVEGMAKCTHDLSSMGDEDENSEESEESEANEDEEGEDEKGEDEEGEDEKGEDEKGEDEEGEDEEGEDEEDEVNEDEERDQHLEKDEIEWRVENHSRKTLIFPEGYDAELFEVPSPRPCLYPKLLALLEAGCDPNLQDNYGKTPSDYVRSNPVFWLEWKRALNQSGWVYNAQRMLCARKVGNGED